MKKTLIFTLLTVLTLQSTLKAQTLPSLLCGSDAATLGTACTGVAGKANAYAIENNVAAMSMGDKKLYVGASYGIWQPSYADNSIISAAGSFKTTERLDIGASFKNFSYSPYDIITESGSASREGSFTPKEFNAAIGASFAITPALSVGAAARILEYSLSNDVSSTVLGLDLGLCYTLSGLRAGLSLNNLGSGLPSLLKAGALYGQQLGEQSAISFQAEADYMFSGAFMAGAGVEYAFKDLAFLRCGYHYGDAAKTIPSYASAGFGVKFAQFSVDAAYLFASEVLGGSLSLSLGYSF